MTYSYIHTAGTTPEFAAPELLEHRFKDIDESTDIYAIGSLLQHIENKTGKKLPPTLQKIKKRSLQKEKEKRYAATDDIIRIIKNRRALSWSKVIAVAAVIATLVALFFNCGLYTKIETNIGWKQNRYPTRFEADGIFYNITDSIIVGQFIGKEALAAVSASFFIYYFIISFAIGAGSGTTVVISQLFGAKQYQKVQLAFSSFFIFMMIAGAILSLAGIIFAKDIFLLMKTPEEVIPEAVAYFQIYIGGTFLFMTFNSVISILRGMGESIRPMIFI
jgi:hypothetical protein